MEKKTQLSEYDTSSVPDGREYKIGIITAEWNEQLTESLKKAANKTLIKHGVKEENIKNIYVPGSYELPMGARMLLGEDKYDAIICLGCVIEGETKHNEYINHAVAESLIQLSMSSNIPCIYGVVTTYTVEQAQARSGGDRGNKGTECAVAALKMAHLSKSLGEKKNKIGF